MRKRVTTALFLGCLVLAGSMESWACVGKILHVGVISRGEEKLLTKILSILVNERTGTSVKISEFGSFKECFAALEKNEIDVVIAYTGQGYVEINEHRQAESADKILTEVRQSFNERYNLVWLEPWGLSDGAQFVKDTSGKPLQTWAAPLVRKETLKEFPALARLINKMAGRLNDATVSVLLKKVGPGDSDRAARDYLKAEKLI